MMRFALLATLFAFAKADWDAYLKSLTGKSRVDWKEACKALGQSPQGYSMSGGGGFSTYHLTCTGKPYTIKCKGYSNFAYCTSNDKPPASAASLKAPATYGAKAGGGSCGGFTAAEAQQMLDYHNKLRCALGYPAVAWSTPLECQAQKTQNQIGAFSHSHSYSLPIKSGENLATGTDPAQAFFMWVLEYTNSGGWSNSRNSYPGTGHFTAMAWKAVTHIGCGVQRSGKGVIRCQYFSKGGTPPNFGGNYGSNLHRFDPTAAEWEKCGIPISELKSQAKMQASWGLDVHPSMIGRLFSGEGNMMSLHDGWTMAVAAGCVFSGALLAGVAFITIRRKINARGTRTFQAVAEDELLQVESPAE